MKAVEAVKEKFYCFLGIVHPTYYQSRGWGTWLPNTHPPTKFSLFFILTLSLSTQKVTCDSAIV